MLDETSAIGGLGVIANNFRRRTDLTPNIHAVYVEPRARGRGVARALIDRAWQATVRALRSLTGGSRTAQEQPA